MQINSSIPNLIGGVSQQPELLRLPSHLRAQENSYCSPSKGLSKRPPTSHLAYIPQFPTTGFFDSLDYGDRGLVHLNITADGAIRVALADGSAAPLYDGAGTPITSAAYLVNTDPETAIRVVKEADTTFLLNTQKVAQAASLGAVRSGWTAMIWVKAGNYGRDYKVTVPGVVTATYTTPDGSTASHITQTKTDVIAASLAAQLQAAMPGVTVDGSVITIEDAPEGITVEDGSGGAALSAIRRKVSSIAELPARRGKDTFFVQVEGGDATAAGDYYLNFNSAEGVYKEVANPLAATQRPDPATMPHVLVPYTDGFQVKPLDWVWQAAGDADSNPGPSFLGKRINDLFFFQDRLGMLSGEGFDLSETGEYYNFYRTTVRDLLDTDPVSGTVQHPKVSTLRHAVPFNKRLLYFSDKAQFELAMAGDTLTPQSAETRKLTEFEASSVVRPLGVGTSMYFPVDRGNFSAFYNFFVSGVDALEDTTDVSGHVSEYIPRQVTQMVASPVNNILIAFSKQDPSRLYVYQFYQDGPQRLQSAWHRWTFTGAQIKSLMVLGTTLQVIAERDGVVVAESMPLTLSGAGSLLDRRFTAAPGSYVVTGSGVLAVTSLTLPYPAGAEDCYAVVTADTANRKVGTVAKLQTTSGSTAATLTGDFSTCTIDVGVGYRQSGTLGRFLLREQAGQGSAGVSRGRTQVARMWVNYADAGAFDVQVSAEGRDPVTYRCTGRNVGSGGTRVGERPVRDGRFGCPVLSENTRVEITLINDSPLPASFLSVDWEGYHVSRGQHV